MRRIFPPFSFPFRRLGPLEVRMLDGLWARGSATVRELLETDYPDLAYTTLMTTLDRLFKKGLLTRTEEGRAFRYAPCVTREELHREAASHALRQLLDASSAANLPLSFLVEMVGERDEKLLDDLAKLVECKRRELNERGRQGQDSRAKGTQ
ncbi:MAG: BlaI/MecI/CopY family transcriptional regulator [Candidatus Sulfotelmatobacter sp.]